MIVLIDNGHGSNTLGKRSPDGKLKEFSYTREVAKKVVTALTKGGYDARLITPETTDISISERCRRVNAVCAKYGSSNCLLVSIHNDALGNGSKWYTARGFSVRVSLNASNNSKRLARTFTETAIKMNLMGNRSIPKEKYWSQNLGICRDTHCPAVLTENLFMDSKSDVDFLLSKEGKEAIANLHINAILKYING